MKKRQRLPIRRLWEELRRRHVVRVLIYYVVFAWVVIQVGDVLLEAFELDHLLRYVVAGVVILFPVVLALSWMFDITPEGVERTAPMPDSTPAPFEAPSGSLAVLPFANLSDEADNEYFSDGLSEEIRNQLACVPGLKVAARTSSFSFKDRHEDVREIGRRLNVAVILEGGVRKHADTVRINLQLVSAADGFQLWSESFERRFVDIFRLQSEIAQAVTRIVSPLSGAAQQRSTAEVTANFEAYNMYLRGRHHFHKRTESALQRAIDCFEQAIQLDSGYALAWSGLGDAWTLISTRYYGDLPVSESVEKALPAALNALELAPQLAEAHATLGLVRENQGDLRAAADSLRRSLELNPEYTMALVWYGLVLVSQGKFKEAEKCNREALQLDPLSPIINVNAGFDALRYAEFALAKASFQAAVEIDPAFPVAHYGLSCTHAREKNLDAALSAIDRAIELAPWRTYYEARRGLILLQMERIEEASGQLLDVCCKAPYNPFDADLIVAVYMIRQDRENLSRVSRGECVQEYSAAQQAQAMIAIGDYESARAQYEKADLDLDREVIDLVTTDWVWRLPHVINRAHLRILAGDSSGEAELSQLLDQLDAIAAQGIVTPLASYWRASANAVLGRTDTAQSVLATAREQGWQHRWWERIDWNVRSLAKAPSGSLD